MKGEEEQYPKLGMEGGPTEDAKEEPPVPRKIFCCCWLTYEKGTLIICGIDCIALVTVMILIIHLGVMTSGLGLSSGFRNVILVLPIVGLVLILLPRSLVLPLLLMNRSNLKFRRVHSLIRSITSVLMFGFTLTMMSILVLLY